MEALDSSRGGGKPADYVGLVPERGGGWCAAARLTEIYRHTIPTVALPGPTGDGRGVMGATRLSATSPRAALAPLGDYLGLAECRALGRSSFARRTRGDGALLAASRRGPFSFSRPPFPNEFNRMLPQERLGWEGMKRADSAASRRTTVRADSQCRCCMCCVVRTAPTVECVGPRTRSGRGLVCRRPTDGDLSPYSTY